MNKLALVSVLLAAIPACAADRAALLEEIRQAERDFCALVVQDGAAVAFPAFMAEPSVFAGDVFPTRAAALAALGQRKRRPGVATHWEPVFADVSTSGDFGYAWGNSWTTGLTMPEGQPRAAEGFTFTVWRKQADGTWKFILDAGGSSTPATVAEVLAAAKARPMNDEPVAIRARADPVAIRAGLREQDEAMGAAPDRATGYLAQAADDAFSLDTGAYGKAALAERFARLPAAPLRRECLHAEVAPSGDLAYTFGAWSSGAGEGAYFTMWKRQREGEWRWVIDHTFAAPPGPLAEKLKTFRAAVKILHERAP